jgi:nicotinamide riboside transporter PnuC
MDEIFQVTAWALTLAGQVLVTRRRKSAFVVWGLANMCMIAVQIRAELLLSAGMFVTNLAFCAWSFWMWKRDELRQFRTLFVGKLS